MKEKFTLKMGIIRKQGLSNSIITYIGIAIGFVNLIFIQPLFLTTEELGLTRILFSVSYLVSTFIPLGVANITTKYFPIFKDSDKKNHGFFGLMLAFLAVGVIISGIILYLINDFIYYQYHKESPLFTDFFSWIFPFSIILSLVTVLNIYCYSLYKTLFASILNDIIVRILSTVLFGIYFIKFITLNLMITLFVGIYGFQVISLLMYILKNNAFNLKIDYDFLKKNNFDEIIKFGFVFTLASVASYAIKFLDGIVMGKYHHLDIVGIYAVMTFIPSFIEAPLFALEKIANPKISAAIARNDKEDMQDIYYKSCRFLMALGGLLLILIYTNAAYLLHFMKPEYYKGLNVIYIISFSATFNLYTGTNNAIVFNSKNYVFGTILLICIMLLTLFMNELLIPIWGMKGAAFATTIASLIFNLIKFLFIKYKFKLQPYDFRNVKIIAITLLSLGILYILPEASNVYFSSIYKTILLSSVYLGLIYISKSIKIEEIMK